MTDIPPRVTGPFNATSPDAPAPVTPRTPRTSEGRTLALLAPEYRPSWIEAICLVEDAAEREAAAPATITDEQAEQWLKANDLIAVIDRRDAAPATEALRRLRRYELDGDTFTPSATGNYIMADEFDAALASPEPTPGAAADTPPPPGYHFTESSDRVAVKDEPTPDSGLDVERLARAVEIVGGKSFDLRASKRDIEQVAAEYEKNA